ncbi:hypothetical protein KL929_001932 [Ogataea haglerorum]|nr:hypothetical protein KL913_001881 [Ogataea haglerorum]KAG7721759.1 hypothetical protein KL949_001491 [Ogataea haglerorum]KAG7770087.1 hypothetical protein KL931_002606 [Ogataea haglerorum]KAG7797967.1 hypothetical protein KL929_001932 [Ogataea haglerorum]KAG7802736.1 hypothetical protein KL944_002383 [Ogataea haglerorum]
MLAYSPRRLSSRADGVPAHGDQNQARDAAQTRRGRQLCVLGRRRGQRDAPNHAPRPDPGNQALLLPRAAAVHRQRYDDRLGRHRAVRERREDAYREERRAQVAAVRARRVQGLAVSIKTLPVY